MLHPTLVDVQLVSFTSERRVELEAKVFCKILHMAVVHGWHPERVAAQPPSADWDTEIIVPYIQPYLSGSVSDTDAKDLAGGLRRMLASEYVGLSHEFLYSALAVLAVADRGAFGLSSQANTTGPGPSEATKPHGPGSGAAATG